MVSISGTRWRKYMNPLEWGPWLYGKFFASHHPFWGYLFACSVAFILALLAWTQIKDKYEAEHPRIAAANQPPNHPAAIVVEGNGSYKGIDTRIYGTDRTGIELKDHGKAETYGLQVGSPKPRTALEMINSFILTSEDVRKGDMSYKGWNFVVSDFLNANVSPKSASDFLSQPTLDKRVEFLKKLKASLPKN